MPRISSKRRVLAHYDFENGGSVEIVCSTNVDTATALDIADTLLTMKQKEMGGQQRGTPRRLKMVPEIMNDS